MKAKTRVVAAIATIFLIGAGAAAGLGWTATSHSMLPVVEDAQVPVAAVQPAMDLSDAFTNLADVVTPAVVRIESRRTVQSRGGNEMMPEQFRRYFDIPEGERGEPRSQLSGGSGFIVSRDGYILTNNHVVEGAQDLRVYFPDRRYFPAEVVGTDPFTDVAVIKVNVDEDLPVMSFGDSDDVRVGEWIVAIGNPGFGASTQLDFTVTAGIISAKGRGLQLLQNDIGMDPRLRELAGYAIEDFIQTDAVINPGNSGGPMVNLEGQVVGINSAIATRTGVYQGYGFAIPINLARRIMEDLIEYGHVKRPRIGVQITDVVAEDAEFYGLPKVSGILVQEVDPTGPSSGSLRAEDVIVALDGEPVGYVSELQAEIAERRPGDRVELTVYRNGRPVDVTVRLGEAPINDVPAVMASNPVLASERLGIQVEALTPQLLEQLPPQFDYQDTSGVILRDVMSGSAAERRGVGNYRGWKVVEINQTPIQLPDDVRRALEGVQPGQVVSLHFENPAGDRRFLNVRMP
ncbi:MAG: trypsin-like peptidase domain-containing protein [Longimicrobiales bacterium]|nr:trypsin-like peptidase domain-containing protein [Longimicrobiales bacterium]